MDDTEIRKLVLHWKQQAIESWSDAEYLVKGKRYSLGLFTAHLALEKILKAHVWQKTRSVPPRIHNLIRLAELAGVSLEQEQVSILSAMNEFQLEGRYADMLMPPPQQDEARQYLKRAKEMFEWLKKQL
jgi:HEPN domain-containing protein